MFWMPPNHDIKCWYHDLIGHWSSFHGKYPRANESFELCNSGGRIMIGFEVTEGVSLRIPPGRRKQ